MIGVSPPETTRPPELEPKSPVAREDVETAGAQLHVPLERDAHGAALSSAELTDALLVAALELGFSSAGVLPLERFEEAGERLEAWLAAGLHGEMDYLLTGGARNEPATLLPGARSALVVTLSHPARGPEERSTRPTPGGDTGEPRGKIAKYARGRDYHTVLKGLLLKLADECARLVNRPVVGRACIDTAPLLEREASIRAGLGFVGKNTMTIVPGVGSYVMLGELLLDVDLEPRSLRRHAARLTTTDGCGKCTLCLEACPTGAFVGPYQLDARRCISYLTIEQTGPVARELRPKLGGHVFGCDVCQDVCPFNQTAHKKAHALDLAARPHLESPALVEMLGLSSAGYRRFVRDTALRRTHREHLARNAAIALGNDGSPAAVAPLARALESHPSDLVRGHAAWALGRLARLGRAGAREALEASKARETNAFVREEVDAALAESADAS